MRVMVTGHLGYIGSVLVPMLLDRGHDVRGMDTDYFGECTFAGSVADVPNIRGDIRDAEEEDFAGVNAVIHLAALSNDPLGNYSPNLTFDINVGGAMRVARCAKAAGVERFLFASSCSTYGASGESFLDETAGFKPVTPYAESKVRVEEALAKLADGTFSPTYIRASTAYGASPRLRFDIVVNDLTASATTTGQVYIKSDGTPWRPQVHVEDICLAYISALEAPRQLVHNEAFNIGLTSENYQVRDIAEIVKQIVPNSRIEYAPDAGPDPRCYRVNCNKVATILHAFKPQWTLRRGVEQLYGFYRSRGLSESEYRGPVFTRITQIKTLIAGGVLDETLRWT